MDLMSAVSARGAWKDWRSFVFDIEAESATSAVSRNLLRQLVDLGIATESGRHDPTVGIAGGIIDVSRP